LCGVPGGTQVNLTFATQVAKSNLDFSELPLLINKDLPGAGPLPGPAGMGDPLGPAPAPAGPGMGPSGPGTDDMGMGPTAHSMGSAHSMGGDMDMSGGGTVEQDFFVTLGLSYDCDNNPFNSQAAIDRLVINFSPDEILFLGILAGKPLNIQ
jgi:hypothetical protein